AHCLGLNLLHFSYKFLPSFLFRQLLSIDPSVVHKKNVFDENFFRTFKVGLAAGLDKNAQYIQALAACGFDFIEIGTVTPRPQPGNPKPRLFRLIKDEAIINRMGFNNDGADVIYQRLKQLKEKNNHIVIGANIGKNKDTPNEEAINDYLYCFRKLYAVADYFVVNVSSPNTPNLRALQEKDALTTILSALKKEEQSLRFLSKHDIVSKPIFLKIAPDLSDEQLKDISEVIIQTGITGIIATNTTISRENIVYEKNIDKYGAGGLSGKPLFEKSLKVVKKLRNLLPKEKTIIGVGGIDSVEKALQMKEAGADSIQIYTAFIYRGPKIISEIKRKML
ncbi:MAG: quinone-dependent dihydroorotate dehydrogenase, partial [Bacteroidia bacterium]|nr:quinone-dependent dihydroorotate dehydrogenase [Bacteroidia bacterium]